MNLKTTLLSGIFLLLFIITPNVNAQLTYTGPFSNDFMNPTPLTLGPGINTISNEFTTPPTYQAWFDVDLPAGLIITNVTFAVNGADATGSSGLMCWNPFSSCNPSDTWNGDQVATSITTWQTPGTLPISSSPGVIQVSSNTGAMTNWTLQFTVCAQPDAPTVTAMPAIVNNGDTSTLNIAGMLNGAEFWAIYTDSCGGDLVGTTTTNSFVVTPPLDAITTYFIRGEGGCASVGECGTVDVEATDLEAPMGYSVQWDDTLIGAAEAPNTSFTVSNAELGTTLNYAISSAGDGNVATLNGTVTITSATQVIPVDVSSLTDGVLIIQITLTDTAGNTGSLATDNSATLDQTNPNAVCAGTVLVQLDASGMGSIVAGDIDNGSSDASGIASTTIDIEDFTCVDIGMNTVTLTVVDNAGNFSTCTTQVTVEDNEAPTASCVAPFTIQLDAMGMVSITAADVDNGSADACGTVTTSIDVTDFTCADIGTPVTVTLTVTDNNMNVSTCTTTVTVEDMVAPIANCAAPFTVQLDAMGMVSIDVSDIENGSTDACGIASTSIDVTSFTCAEVGENTVTLTVTDVNGNTATCETIVTVEDNIAPVTSCVAPFTVQLDAMGMASITAADVDNGSVDACGIANTTIDVTNFTCADVGTPVTVTLTVTDNNMNISTCTTTVTVEDTVAPTASCVAPFTVQLDAMGMASITTADVDNGSEDACGIMTTSIDVTDFTCADVGTPVTVTLTVTDNNMNVSTCTTMVTVEDTVAPMASCVAPFTVVLDNSGMASITVDDIENGSTDACGVATTSIDITQFTCANVGENVVTLMVTDVNGNIATCTTTVTVEDDSPITIISGPQDFTTGTGESAGSCEISVNYGAITTDDFVVESNCGDASANIESIVLTSGLGNNAIFPVGITTEEYTLTDVNGNEFVYTFDVIIVDTTLPVVDCPNDDVIVSGDDEGNYMIEDYAPTVSDNCSSGADLVITQDPVAGTVVTDPSTTEITLTATDAAGNTTTCAFNLVVDETLGVNDLLLEGGLSLYPNPTSDIITITATDSFDSIRVFDLSGRVVAQQNVSATSAEVSLASFSSGVYLLQITQGVNTVTKRVIRE